MGIGAFSTFREKREGDQLRKEGREKEGEGDLRWLERKTRMQLHLVARTRIFLLYSAKVSVTEG